jgi:hypothetical protein
MKAIRGLTVGAAAVCLSLGTVTGSVAAAWAGTAPWRAVPSPAFAAGGALDSVAADSPHDAWAVGSGGGRALIEHWSGRAWKVSFTAPPGTTFTEVAVARRSSAWAVGAAPGGGSAAYHWNGRRWSLAAAGLIAGQVDAVADTRSAGAWVLQTISGGGIVAERFAGSRWHQVGATLPPPTGGFVNSLQANSIAAVDANDVWLAGASITCVIGRCDSFPYTAHWDGTAWSTPLVPVRADGVLNRIRDIDGKLYAAGWQAPPFQQPAPLIVTLVNGKWQEMPAEPAFVFPLGPVTGITGDGADGLWVSATPNAGPPISVLFHWNGTQWVSQFAPPADPSTNMITDSIAGMAEVRDTPTVWAVGSVTGASSPIAQELTDVTGPLP